MHQNLIYAYSGQYLQFYFSERLTSSSIWFHFLFYIFSFVAIGLSFTEEKVDWHHNNNWQKQGNREVILKLSYIKLKSYWSDCIFSKKSNHQKKHGYKYIADLASGKTVLEIILSSLQKESSAKNTKKENFIESESEIWLQIYIMCETLSWLYFCKWILTIKSYNAHHSPSSLALGKAGSKD